MENTFFYNTRVARIGISDNGHSITKVYYADDIDSSNTNINETPLISKAAKQIIEYLDGERTTFDLPIETTGTEFQKKVWKALMEIPYGQTQSYKDIAIKVGSPLAYRAVGMANNKNPISIIIPCHRVIGANGKLVGYGGGLDIKVELLNIEKEKIK
ncbi:MAG: methylated-DNA--[protein]-cysteine S-methyltransferase [Epulopiscium sp.]|nr:methylated-DNA--[protein]-cysteine S-methyltransferase [Candidatus Epulonipiscium sp.]